MKTIRQTFEYRGIVPAGALLGSNTMEITEVYHAMWAAILDTIKDSFIQGHPSATEVQINQWDKLPPQNLKFQYYVAGEDLITPTKDWIRTAIAPVCSVWLEGQWQSDPRIRALSCKREANLTLEDIWPAALLMTTREAFFDGTVIVEYPESARRQWADLLKKDGACLVPSQWTVVCETETWTSPESVTPQMGYVPHVGDWASNTDSEEMWQKELQVYVSAESPYIVRLYYTEDGIKKQASWTLKEAHSNTLNMECAYAKDKLEAVDLTDCAVTNAGVFASSAAGGYLAPLRVPAAGVLQQQAMPGASESDVVPALNKICELLAQGSTADPNSAESAQYVMDQITKGIPDNVNDSASVTVESRYISGRALQQYWADHSANAAAFIGISDCVGGSSYPVTFHAVPERKYGSTFAAPRVKACVWATAYEQEGYKWITLHCFFPIHVWGSKRYDYDAESNRIKLTAASQDVEVTITFKMSLQTYVVEWDPTSAFAIALGREDADVISLCTSPYEWGNDAWWASKLPYDQGEWMSIPVWYPAPSVEMSRCRIFSTPWDANAMSCRLNDNLWWLDYIAGKGASTILPDALSPSESWSRARFSIYGYMGKGHIPAWKMYRLATLVVGDVKSIRNMGSDDAVKSACLGAFATSETTKGATVLVIRLSTWPGPYGTFLIIGLPLSWDSGVDTQNRVAATEWPIAVASGQKAVKIQGESGDLYIRLDWWNDEVLRVVDATYVAPNDTIEEGS